MDPAAAPLRPMEAVETGQATVRGTATEGREPGLGGPNGRQPPRPRAHQPQPGLVLRDAGRLLGTPRPAASDRPVTAELDNRRVRTRTHGGVTGKAREGLPMSIPPTPFNT